MDHPVKNLIVYIQYSLPSFPSFKLQVTPLSVELVWRSCVDLVEFFIKVGSEVDGGVEVLPDEGVVLHVLDVVLLRHVARGQVPDAVHGHDADVLNSSQ